MRKLYLLILVAFISLEAGAQSFLKLTQTTYIVNTIDTSTQPIIDSIYNIDTVPYRSYVKFYARIDTSSFIFTTDSLDFSSSPLDSFGTPSTARRIPIHIPYNQLVGGPTGIVIWPIYNNGQAGVNDTIRLTAHVAVLAGIEGAPLAKIYIIQRGGNLNIHFGDYQDIVQQVSLYNIEGQQIFSGSAGRAQNIPTSSWSTGIYFCEIKTYKGETRTIKFVLQ